MHKLIVFITDIVFLTTSYLLAFFIRNSFQPPIHQLPVYLEVFPIIILIFIVTGWSMHLYSHSTLKKPFQEMLQITKSEVLLALLVMSLAFLQKVDYSRIVIIIFAVISIPMLIAGRQILHKINKIFHIDMGNIESELRMKLAKGEALPESDSVENKMLYELIKWIADKIFAFVGLVILMPIWLIIAIAIKMDSRGPVIFKHERVGKYGKRFVLYKFRTMRKETDSQRPAPTHKNDSRITRFGRLLRKTSLDEAPQFLNVLKGDMSVVGPRPEMPFIVKEYSDWQKRRLEVKPGITGLWQVLGRKEIPLKDNLEYDFYYIENRSIFLDLVILFKTVWIVISGKGAY